VANDSSQGQFIENTVKIKRCAAVVKGGRRFSFAAMVVVGDGSSKAGWGYGKANEVPSSVEKANKQASRSMIEIPVEAGTIPHQVEGRFGAARVLLVPAGPGTGVIAGGGVRAVMEAVGVKDVLSKTFGSANTINIVKATLEALAQLRDPVAAVERRKGVSKPAEEAAS